MMKNISNSPASILDNEIEKLQTLFDKKYYEIIEREEENANCWVDYLDTIDSILIHNEWLQDYWNDSKYNNYICIDNPESNESEFSCPFIIVSPSTAKKALELMGLP